MNRSYAAVAVGVAVVGVVGLVALGAAASQAPPVRRVARRVAGQLGRWWSVAELTVSETAARLGLDNTPTLEAEAALDVLAAQVLDPLRQALGHRVRVTSGYRSPALNEAVDGSATSQHMQGEAVDFVVDGLTAEQVATLIVRAGIPFDQLIWYAPERGGHVHVSFTMRRSNRGEMMHAKAGGGYEQWAPVSSSALAGPLGTGTVVAGDRDRPSRRSSWPTSSCSRSRHHPLAGPPLSWAGSSPTASRTSSSRAMA